MTKQVPRGRSLTALLGYSRVSLTRKHKQPRVMRFKVSGTLVIKIPSVLEGFSE